MFDIKKLDTRWKEMTDELDGLIPAEDVREQIAAALTQAAYHRAAVVICQFTNELSTSELKYLLERERLHDYYDQRKAGNVGSDSEPRGSAELTQLVG